MKKRLTPEEAAKALGVAEITLEKWRARREGPPFAKIGRKVVYPEDRLEEWLDAQVLDPSKAKS